VGTTSELAHALLGRDAGSDQLAAMRQLAALSEDALAQRLEAANVNAAFARALRPRLQRLAQGKASTGAELHSKFAQEGSFDFEMVYGAVATFFGGLEAKIGPPDPLVEDAMAREHLEASDSHEWFTTFNYGVTTTPRLEWWFVAEPERNEAWPVETKLDDMPERQRKPLASHQLVEAVERFNARLRGLDEAELLRVEGVGARLYTGPMCAGPPACERLFVKSLFPAAVPAAAILPLARAALPTQPSQGMRI
jgi:hypothetical protein